MKNLFNILLVLSSLILWAKSPVIIDGRTQVKLEISKPIPAEKTAEKELKDYLKKIFASPKGRSSAKTQIILRYDSKLGAEEFKIICQNNKVIISGGRKRGVLFGAYYFLDRKLGVHWFDPYNEYCPSKEKISLNAFTKHGKPAFKLRGSLYGNSEEGFRWASRNLLSSNHPKRDVDVFEKYGEEVSWSLPLGAHGMLGLIPGDIYKNHPEFFAVQDGKRIDGAKRGVTTDYCLTNEALIKETIKRARQFLKMSPNAKYLSVSEGDGNRGMCGCEPCQKLVKAHGNRESARWIYFLNRVGSELKKDYPNVKLVCFAYITSQQPPVNIKANDNVAVQIVTLGIRRGRPYTDAKNKMANKFLETIVYPWQKVCKNVMIWDYVWGGSHWMTYPDQLINLKNIQELYHKGITEGWFPEEIGLMTGNTPKQGCPFRPWLLARGMWDPNECGDGEELETLFCNEYYGKAAGPYVKQYYKYLRDEHWKSGFVGMTSGGTLVSARFEAPEVTAKSHEILQKALEAAKKEQIREHIRRTYEATLPVKLLIATDYAKVKQFTKLDKTAEGYIAEMRSYIRGKSKSQKDWTRFKQLHRILNMLGGIGNIVAYANREYGRFKAGCAYDNSFATNWTPGLGNGWIMIDLGNNRFINRITSTFHQMRYVKRVTYIVEGSFDKKAWRVMIPKRTATVPEKLQQTGDPHKVYLFDDVTLPKDVEARYIRTRIIKMERRLPNGQYSGQDAQLMEQSYNLKELPKELEKSIIKE